MLRLFKLRIKECQPRRFSSTAFEKKADEYFNKYTHADMKAYLRAFGSAGAVHLSTHPTLPGISTISIDFPEKKNAFSGKMMVELHEAVEKMMLCKQSKALLIRSRTAPFCSGADLELVKKLNRDEGVFIMHTIMSGALRSLYDLPVPVIAAVDGYAIGGGSELVAACDIRFGAQNCKVGFVQGRMGVSPGWGGAHSIVRALGASQALHYLSTAALVNASELLQAGFLQGTYTEEAELEAMLKKFTLLERDVVVAAKTVVREFTQASTAEGRKREAELFTTLWGGPIQREALAKATKHLN